MVRGEGQGLVASLPDGASAFKTTFLEGDMAAIVKGACACSCVLRGPAGWLWQLGWGGGGGVALLLVARA